MPLKTAFRYFMVLMHRLSWLQEATRWVTSDPNSLTTRPFPRSLAQAWRRFLWESFRPVKENKQLNLENMGKDLGRVEKVGYILDERNNPKGTYPESMFFL